MRISLGRLRGVAGMLNIVYPMLLHFKFWAYKNYCTIFPFTKYEIVKRFDIMNNIVKIFMVYLALLSVVALVFSSVAIADEKPDADMIAEGKALAFDRKKGNCLSCHYIVGAESPGNIGPALVGMKARYSKSELRKRIWDITAVSPEAAMPPFGKHQILSEDEIDKITEYISTL